MQAAKYFPKKYHMSPDEKKLNMRIAGFYLAVLILLTGCSDAGKKSD